MHSELDWFLCYKMTKQESYIDASDIQVQQEYLDYQNPEDLMIEKQEKENSDKAFDNLSDEAKEIIQMILQAPSEFLSIFGLKTFRSANPTAIETVLRKQWKDARYAHQVVKEIVNFVETI